MIKLNENQLRQLQMIELEMLVEVDRICKKCEINYNIIAGTMLGAVRHGGFIPWDDDVDVAMLREAYERFRIACQTELDNERFYFQDYRNTKGYRWGYGKLRRKNTIFCRENQEHMPYEQGVFIDIFPMDSIPDNYILRKIHDFKCFFIRKVLWSAVGKYHDKFFLKRMSYKLLNMIPEDMIKKELFKFEQKSNKKEGRYVRMLMFPSPNNVLGYERHWYENLKKIKFEDVEVMGIEDKHEYLSFTYGDYMKLPDVEERKIHPVSILKLCEVEKCKQ